MAPHPVKPRAGRHGERGFTLIEVMVAIVLAAVATSGIIGLYTSVTRASSYSRHATEAAVLAEDQVERLRTQTATIAASGTQTGVNDRGKVNSGGIYTRTWTVTPMGSFADVVVTVAWDENGETRQVVVRSKRNL